MFYLEIRSPPGFNGILAAISLPGHALSHLSPIQGLPSPATIEV